MEMHGADCVNFLLEKYNFRMLHGAQDKTGSFMGEILKDVLSQFPKYKVESKNSEDSIRYREEGNRYFASGHDLKAIEYYTKSLAYADNQELMAYAHGNRSACLYNMKMFKECLIDIDAALSLGYPEEKHKKLLERRARALMNIQRIFKIEVTATKDDKFRERDNSGSPNKKMEEKIYEMIMMETENVNQPRYITDEGQPKLVYGPSKEAPVASDGVRIAYSEKFGRHLVATKVFNPGDILMIEEPYIHMIVPHLFYTHCHHCLKKSHNLIPCSVCPIAQYCSAKCREAAWNSAHRLECPILVSLNGALIGNSNHLKHCMKSLRFLITVTKGGKAIEELRQDMQLADLNKDKRTAGFTAEGIFDTANARSALSLATNVARIPLIALSVFAYFAAVTALLLATRTNFFGKQCSVKLANGEIFPDLAFCGALLLKCGLINNINNFSIKQNGINDSGAALYVVHSLFNHSCEQNAFSHFNDLKFITRALRRIRPGDQIFISYGPSYVNMSKQERQAILQCGYMMDCECIACLENWPMHNVIAKNHTGSTFINPSSCSKANLILATYVLWLDKNIYDIKAIKGLLLSLMDANVTKPCEEIKCMEQLFMSYYSDA